MLNFERVGNRIVEEGERDGRRKWGDQHVLYRAQHINTHIGCIGGGAVYIE